MCGKPSQTFLLGDPAGGAGGAMSGLILVGAGVLTDLTTDVLPSAATTIILRDGTSPASKVIFVATPATRAPEFHGANFEFENGLFYELAGVGPNFGSYTIGAYIQDDSPDPMVTQMIRIREEITRSNEKLYKFLEGLYRGDPAT